MLWHIWQRCRAAEGIADVVVATTDQPADDAIVAMCAAYSIPYFRGSEHDVLDRYYQAALRFQADPVLRITADCPVIDPGVMVAVLQMHQLSGRRYDIVGAAAGAGAIHTDGCHFPDGVDVECYSFTALQRLAETTFTPFDREHVSPYAWRHPEEYAVGRVFAPADYSAYRLTVDYEEDYFVIKNIYEVLWRPDSHFGLQEILAYLTDNPDVPQRNQQYIGREGYDALWQTGEFMTPRSLWQRSGAKPKRSEHGVTKPISTKRG